MAIHKITEQEMDANGVCAAPDILNGTPAENKAVFDRMIRQVVAPAYNACAEAVDQVEARVPEWEAAEQARQEAEVQRETAENARVLAEEKRAAAEQKRQTAEVQRETAETQRKDAEIKREDKETGYIAQAKHWAEEAQKAAGGGVTSFNGRSGTVKPETGDYTPEMVGAVSKNEKGKAEGVATLDRGGRVPSSQLPELENIAKQFALEQALWSGTTYILQDTMLKKDGYAYIVTPDVTSIEAYAEFGLQAKNVSTDGELQFTAKMPPTGIIKVIILRIEVQ